LQQIEAELDARLEAERKAADEAKELRDSVNVDATRETYTGTSAAGRRRN
jgi:hypothetical protein